MANPTHGAAYSFAGAMIFVALASSVVFAQDPVEESSEGVAETQTVYHLGCEDGDCLVPPWTAKPSEARQFLRQGGTIDAKGQSLSFFERWSFRRALVKFPDAQSCLDQNANTSIGVDLTRVDWTLITNQAQAEVCFFRISNALGDPTRTVRWLEILGFSAYETQNPKGHYLEGWTTVHANWKGDGISPFQSLSFKLEESLTYAFGLGIDFDPKGGINNVNLNFIKE